MGAIERCSKLLQVWPVTVVAYSSKSYTLQHWSSGFESTLSSVLNANRDAAATSSLQLQHEIQSRDTSIAELSHQLDDLRATNARLTSEVAITVDSRDRAAAAAAEHEQRIHLITSEAEARCAALESKMEEQAKRHEEYAGFIAEVRFLHDAQSFTIARSHDA